MDQLLCEKCKTMGVVEGRKCCHACLKKQREYMRKLRANRAKRGLCEGCAINKRRQNGIYCDDCLESQRQERLSWKEGGLCIVCGKTAVPNKSKCSKCIEYSRKQDREQRIKRQRAGLCVKCGVEIVRPPYSRCDKCRSVKTKQATSLAQKRRSLGLCVNCRNKAINGNRFCDVCYLKHTASKRVGSSGKWKELKCLFEDQRGICPYTGIELRIGINTELDHIVPRSKGGVNDVANLQWVYAPVNTMKWDMDETEFLNVVFDISRWRIERKYGN